MKSFSQVIFKVGINPCVVPPDDVLRHICKQAHKRKGPIPVRGTIGGAQYTQTLVKYLNHWRLYVNGPMLKNGVFSTNSASFLRVAASSKNVERTSGMRMSDILRYYYGLRRTTRYACPSLLSTGRVHNLVSSA
jgi:hypothetical protein